ncbi:MAG: SLC13 family permease, partial [Verrucomicrobiota bacterium]|nr:SLC13 family permease [Verrucomicrobiota bacterium]
CLLESGGAERIVRSALALLGEKRAPLAFTGSGFLLGTPVFFDTVFYLMIPLGKALAMRFRENYGLYIMTIVAGATMAHSLVPPTPGPLFVAVQLDVDLGLMILMGLVVGSVACATGYVYAKFVNGHDKWRVPLRDSADSPLAKLEEIAKRDGKSLPPLGLSLLPVLLPIVLIAGNTILEELVGEPPAGLANFMSLVGDKNIALILSAAVALGLLAMQKRGDKQALFDSVQSALASGGVVILITAAGASFGAMLQQTNIAARIGGLAEQFEITGLMVLPMAFFVTALIRTAQGSATVSMITSVGIFAGMAATLPFHPVYLAMAIGCGSKPFPWMNDSGFWVIN